MPLTYAPRPAHQTPAGFTLDKPFSTCPGDTTPAPTICRASHSAVQQLLSPAVSGGRCTR